MNDILLWHSRVNTSAKKIARQNRILLLYTHLTRSRGYICVRNLDFFISWAMIFGVCIDYRSAESIGIRIVLYLKRTLELLISTLILMFCCLLELGKKTT